MTYGFRSSIAFAIPILILASMMFIYQSGSPLAPEEIDEYIDKISRQTQKPGGKHDLEALRNFLEKDDGKPFYTVNLYNYYDHAQYLDGRTGVTGREAYDRFSKVMVKLLAKQSSHPIFASNWMEENENGWDRITIVRYRSRRDIAEIFASTEFAEASAHKWASIEKNERILVQAVHLPEFRVLAIVALLLIGLFLCISLFRNRKT